MISGKTINLVIVCILLQFAWAIFSDEGQYNSVALWKSIGLDITKNYGLHPFDDSETKLKWYAHDSAYFITMSIAFYIVSYTIRPAIYGKILSGFYQFRLVEYWLFDFSLLIETFSIGLIIFSLSIYIRRGRLNTS